MASEDLKSTLVKKEREWKKLQALHAQQLEDALIEATTELDAQRKQFQCLQEDFQFNLKLLEERDHKLECYDAMITKFQISDSTRQEKMSELHVHIGKLQDTVTQKKSQCAELLIMHQQEMAKLQLHLETLSSEKNEEIQRLKEENEDLKNSLRLKLEVSEGELVLQKQKMMVYFDVEMRKQEHEYNLKIDDLCSEVLSYKLKKLPRLLVASSDGYLYIYNVDPQDGGECVLVNKHRLFSGEEEEGQSLEEDSMVGGQTYAATLATPACVEHPASAGLTGYSEDGGAKKGEVIPEHEFAAGPIRLDDEQEFPPVNSQSN